MSLFMQRKRETCNDISESNGFLSYSNLSHPLNWPDISLSDVTLQEFMNPAPLFKSADLLSARRCEEHTKLLKGAFDRSGVSHQGWALSLRIFSQILENKQGRSYRQYGVS